MLDDAVEEQDKFQEEILEFNNKTRPKTKIKRDLGKLNCLLMLLKIEYFR